VALVHAWGSLAGDSEWALRFPSALAGALTVPAMAWLAARWLGRDTVPAAAWLTAGSPFLVWYSQEARSYSQMVLATVVASALMLELRERIRPGVFAAYVAAAAFAALSNFAFLFAVPVHVRWWLSGQGRGRRLLWSLGAALLLALAIVPWVPSISSTWDWSRLNPVRTPPAGEEALRGTTTFHVAGVPFALYSFAVGYTLGPSLRELRTMPAGTALARNAPALIATLLVFGTLGVLGVRALRRRGRLGEALLWTLPAVLVVIWFALSNFKVFNPRYLAAAFPAVLLVLAAAFADLRGAARLALGIAVAALWSVSLAQMWFVPRFGKEDYRSAMARIRLEARPGERLIAAGADHPLDYYNRGSLPLQTLWLGFARDSVRLDRELDRAAGDGGAWIVISRSEDLDPDGRFLRHLGSRYPDAERFRTEGVNVWRIPASAGTH
jgi:4-amino-4-deoxy-L-arabinose transferase-like glycosyltransferase